MAESYLSSVESTTLRPTLIKYHECTEENTREEKIGICGGVGCAHTPTYTSHSSAVDLFFSGFIT